jgi:hypothetical protein
MRAVRFIAGILYYLTRIVSILILMITFYATILVLINWAHPAPSLPIQILKDGSFQIFLPFTHIVFLLGDYSTAYLVTNLLTFAFYGLFLWLLGGVFYAFRQPKLFTKNGVVQLSRFYLINIFIPFVLIVLFVVFGQELGDLIRIILLHLVIGVFAFFMTAIFKQGLILQEEQDLTF